MNGNHDNRGYKQEVQPAVPPPINSMTEHGRPDQHAVDIVSHQPLPSKPSLMKHYCCPIMITIARTDLSAPWISKETHSKEGGRGGVDTIEI